MEINYSRKDFYLVILAGELVAWLSLPTLKNIQALDILAKWGIELKVFAIFWAFFVPICAALGLGFFYLIAKNKNRIGFFQLGKYGVIGVLNTLLNAGIYNLLIFLTNVALGLAIDLFFVVAFVITVINSFFWNRYWAFSGTGTETIGKDAFQFFFVSTIVAIVNIGILHAIVNVIGAPAGINLKIWANIALVFTIITAFLGNFFGYKFIVFKK
ncbi:MAG: GtrA family protein [Candidatus Azambacteria bacterium]|nr:GtrA family protein [Candidatus Azambacteria bacterium]